eukprot:jgi/Bigna1/77540/fgenesh1_pg.48_\
MNNTNDEQSIDANLEICRRKNHVGDKRRHAAVPQAKIIARTCQHPASPMRQNSDGARPPCTLSKNFLKALSTRRSTFGSSEGAPSKTLVLAESGASKNEEQKEESGPRDHRANLMRERTMNNEQ